MKSTLLKNVTIVNENTTFKGSVLIEGELIKTVSKEQLPEEGIDRVIDGEGRFLIPGLIDDQVHFREPGLTHKANLKTESRAAVAGGITSFMEMPNTVPNTVTQELLQDKYDIAAQDSIANYSFFFGATNDNLEEVLKTNPKEVCGVKVFMGSSTGNMLVDNRKTLDGLFAECELLIATHCEDEETIQKNLAFYKEKYKNNIPISAHPIIRNTEACYKSSSMAVELATKHNAKLHILHISTAKELALFDNSKPLSEKRITAEGCVHHAWFTDADYEEKGSFIKWNPAVKTAQDRAAIIEAINNNTIDVLATDHAPHTLEEKNNNYLKAPSGGPLVQHALLAWLELVKKGAFTLEHIVQKTSHDVATLFQISNRGYIREGYYADLVLVDFDNDWEVNKDNILYKCGWSPFEGVRFTSKVEKTFVNGALVYDNGEIIEGTNGKRLLFER
ncbi:MAG: dihydroorotase [Flavobacteriales bacterium]|jgi:dihydroorotase|nr:dihydroorotase [Flavobacteriales bacterium]